MGILTLLPGSINVSNALNYIFFTNSTEIFLLLGAFSSFIVAVGHAFFHHSGKGLVIFFQKGLFRGTSYGQEGPEDPAAAALLDNIAIHLPKQVDAYAERKTLPSEFYQVKGSDVRIDMRASTERAYFEHPNVQEFANLCIVKKPSVELP